MIRIKKVEISNYRSCLKTKLEIHKDLTALIGINGVGKSNILNSLQLLKKINRHRVFHDKEFQSSFSNASIKFDLEVDQVPYSLKTEILFETDDKNIDEVYTARIRIKSKSPKAKRPSWKDLNMDYFDYLDRVRVIGRHLTYRQIEREKNTPLGKLSVDIATYFKTISYYSATQFSDPTKCPISLELEDMRSIRYRNAKPHDKFIFDLFDSFKNDKKSFDRYLNTVNKNGIGLVDNIAFLEYDMPTSSYEVRAGGRIKKIEKNKNLIIPNVVIDDANLSPNQLSEGTFKTLALVFYILNDQSQILLIEEPEVCVHHGLLNSIIELIKFQASTKQIIISTHSDFVLDKLLPENIVLVKKDARVGTLANSLSKSLEKDDYKALKNYLEESGNLGEYWKEGGLENGQS